MKTATRSRAFLCLSPLLLSLGLGLGLNLVVTPTAQACGDPFVSSSKENKKQSFEFANGLKLGLPETTIIETLGEPQERRAAAPATRCGSVLEHYSYNERSTVIFVDRPQLTKPIRRYSQPNNPQQVAQTPNTKVIVRIRTQNPDLSLNSKIRVGDRMRKLQQTYGTPQGEISNPIERQLLYRHRDQQLMFTIDHSQTITAIELFQAEPEITDILAKGR